eukprot:m.82707 g.82707  ORF g.82707 m.82707 type:complete len:524 (+) comp19570_c0_seq1:164-1735(+)
MSDQPPEELMPCLTISRPSTTASRPGTSGSSRPRTSASRPGTSSTSRPNSSRPSTGRPSTGRPSTGRSCSRPSTSGCGAKCVCQMCTCGEHHCNARRVSASEPKPLFEGLSTTQADFVKKAFAKAERKKSATPYVGPSPSKFDGMSTNRHDFTPKKPGTPAWTRPAKDREYRPNSSKFDDTTTSGGDYVPLEWSKRAPIIHSETAHESGPGEYDATYSTDFAGQTAPVRESFKPKVVSPQSDGKNPMSSLTTTGEFQGHPNAIPAESCAPKHGTYERRGTPVDSSTETMMAYTGEWVKPSTPFLPKSQVIEKLPGQYETSYQQDMTAKSPEPRPIAAEPTSDLTSNSGTFFGTTTNMEDFNDKGNAKRAIMRPEVGDHGSGTDFEGTSSYTEAFHPYDKFQGTKSFKPNNKSIEHLPGTYVTTYGNDLTGAKGEIAPSYRPSQSYHGPSGHFSDGTTNREDFTNKGDATRKLMRPPNNDAEEDSGNFEGVSAYTQDFVDHGPSCPSSVLTKAQRDGLSKLHVH